MRGIMETFRSGLRAVGTPARTNALGLTKEEGRMAIEALKEGYGLPHDFHFIIKSNGVVFGKNGVNYGKIFDYLP